MISARALRAWTDPLAWLAGAARTKGRTPEGLLLIEAGGLGDILMLSAVIDAFRPLARKGEPIRLLLRRESAKTAFSMPPDIKIEVIDFYRLMTDIRYRFRMLAEVRAWNVRAALSLDWRRQPWMDDALLMAAAEGAEFSAAFMPKPWPKFGRRLETNAKRLTRLVEAPRPATMIERWLHLSQELTGVEHGIFELRLPANHLDAKPEPLARPTIYLSPFASSRDRQPLPEFWEVLSRSFEGYDVKMLAGPADLDRNPDFVELAERLGVVVRGFKDLIPLFKSASLVIATDSATMHLATLCGAPTLSLSAAAYVGEVLPHAAAYAPANLRMIVTPMPCQGCIGDCRLPLWGERYECVAKIDVNETVETARNMLESARGG